MRPDNAAVRGGLGEGQRARVLSERGKQYAVYAFGGPRATLQLELPRGTYTAEWVSPLTRAVERQEKLSHAGGVVALVSPEYAEDIALRIVRR